MSDLLHKAVRIAFEAHEGQSDKQGEPYIFHVMRVALAVEGEGARALALLHDVVEDSEWTLDDVHDAGIREEVVISLRYLTRTKSETYAGYIEDLIEYGDPDAIAVKLADLRDNLRPERIAALPPEQAASLSKRYHAAYARLSGVSMMPADVVEADRIVKGGARHMVDLKPLTGPTCPNCGTRFRRRRYWCMHDGATCRVCGTYAECIGRHGSTFMFSGPESSLIVSERDGSTP